MTDSPHVRVMSSLIITVGFAGSVRNGTSRDLAGVHLLTNELTWWNFTKLQCDYGVRRELHAY